MKRLHGLVALAVTAALVPMGSLSAIGAPMIGLGDIPDQVLDIYPGLVKISPTTVPLVLDPPDAHVTVETTSSDKATVATTAGEGGDLVVTPKKAGTVYAKVTATKDGFEQASEVFAVKIVEQLENDEYDWHGDAKIGG
ncbi:MAG: hypothetical protein LBJ08_09870, partial [Bifidobacteriaceae bacterium]|nr:hypothetical protein [Bifidobacteriaceae bacterium]